MENNPIVLQRIFNAPVATVWKALTDNEEMRKWYFHLADFRPEVGFRFEFTGGPVDGIQYLHLCEITEVIAEKILSYSWRYDGYEGNSFVTFELTPLAEKTQLKLTHRKLESFPQNNPDFNPENFKEGWNHILDLSLNGYLEKKMQSL